MERAFQGLWWELFYQWECFFQLHRQLTISVNVKIPLSLYEVRKAIKQMKNNVASGAGGIPAETFRRGKHKLWLPTLILKLENDEEIPHDIGMLQL